MTFEKMGGEVVYFGKPYPEVYNQSIDNKNKKILSIGDNLNTDIKGALYVVALKKSRCLYMLFEF